MNMTCPHCNQTCYVSPGLQNTHVRCGHRDCRKVFFAGVNNGSVATITIPLHITISFGGSVDIDSRGKVLVRETANEPPTEYIACNHRCGHNPNRT